MNWYYANGRDPVGPVSEDDWARLVQDGTILPHTLVWNEKLPQWVPFGQVARLAPAHPTTPAHAPRQPAGASPVTPEPRRASFAEQIREHDYTLSVSACLRRATHLGWPLWFKAIGLTAFFFLIWMGASAIPVIGTLSFFISEPFLGGFLAVALCLLRGWEARSGTLFYGFTNKRLIPLMAKGIIEKLLMVVTLGPAALIILLFTPGLLSAGESDPLLTTVVLFVAATFCLPLAYFSVCWIFAPGLIMDYQMPVEDALRLSREKVLQHPWRVTLGLSVAVLGAGLACIALTLPLLTLIDQTAAVVIGLIPGTIIGFAFYYIMIAAMYEAVFTLPPRSTPGQPLPTE